LALVLVFIIVAKESRAALWTKVRVAALLVLAGLLLLILVVLVLVQFTLDG
jgi:hypothetical protein